MWRRMAVIIVIAGTLAVAAYSQALAHAEYVRSDPAQGAVLSAPPSRVTIYFSQQLDMSMSNIVVLGPSGEVVSAGQTKGVANEPKAMYVDLKPGLGGGIYTVQWSNMSAEDGEHASGKFTFSVGTAASLPAGGSGLPLSEVLPAGVALLVAGSGLMLGMHLFPRKRE